MSQTITSQSEMTKQVLLDNITEAIAEVLRTGSSAPKVYVRVQPDGSADITEETNWTCSEDEYFRRVPHTLSLEVLKSTRDYGNLSDDEINECASEASNTAQYEILPDYLPQIEEWIAAGNIQLCEAAPAEEVQRWEAEEYQLSGEAGETEWCESEQEALDAYNALALNRPDECACLDRMPCGGGCQETLGDGTTRIQWPHPMRNHGMIYLEQRGNAT